MKKTIMLLVVLAAIFATSGCGKEDGSSRAVGAEGTGTLVFSFDLSTVTYAATKTAPTISTATGGGTTNSAPATTDELLKESVVRMEVYVYQVDENGNYIADTKIVGAIGTVKNKIGEVSIPNLKPGIYKASASGIDSKLWEICPGYAEKIEVVAGTTTEAKLEFTFNELYGDVTLTLSNIPGAYTIGKPYDARISGKTADGNEFNRLVICSTSTTTTGLTCAKAVSPIKDSNITVRIVDDSAKEHIHRSKWSAKDAVEDRAISVDMSVGNLIPILTISKITSTATSTIISAATATTIASFSSAVTNSADDINITAASIKNCGGESAKLQNIFLSTGAVVSETTTTMTNGQASFSGLKTVSLKDNSLSIEVKSSLLDGITMWPEICITGVTAVGRNTGESAIVVLPNCGC